MRSSFFSLCFFHIYIYMYFYFYFVHYFIARFYLKYPENRDKRISVVCAASTDMNTIYLLFIYELESLRHMISLHWTHARSHFGEFIIKINSIPCHDDEGLSVLRTRIERNWFFNHFPAKWKFIRQCVVVARNRIASIPFDVHIFVHTQTSLIAEASGLGDLRESLASECTPEWFTCHRSVQCSKRSGHKRSVHMGKVYITITHHTRVLTDLNSP